MAIEIIPIACSPTWSCFSKEVGSNGDPIGQKRLALKHQAQMAVWNAPASENECFQCSQWYLGLRKIAKFTLSSMHSQELSKYVGDLGTI